MFQTPHEQQEAGIFPPCRPNRRQDRSFHKRKIKIQFQIPITPGNQNVIGIVQTDKPVLSLPQPVKKRIGLRERLSILQYFIFRFRNKNSTCTL